MNAMRLPPIPGEWIDRNQPLNFTFEGTQFQGYVGDTVTSALWAKSQRVLGRSFKYHRSRGILSLANHDINALMQSGQELNLRADVTPLTSGMSLSAVNTFGGVMSDRAGVIDFFSPFLPVGFYYKAFHNKKLFPLWEHLIRKIAGLGKLDVSTPHIHTPKRYDFCDVLVIGAGPSGLAAALAAAEASLDVVIVDENAQAGGSGGYQLGGEASRAQKTREMLQAVINHPHIRLYTGTQAAGYYADFWVPLVNSDRLAKMRAKAMIVASGAYEQPAVFRNNDIPGVMLASAAQRLIYRYAVKPMHRAVVLAGNSDGYRAALDLAAHGVIVMAVVDLRVKHIETELAQAVKAQGIPIFAGHCIYEARPNPARDGVSSAVLSPLDAMGKPQPQFSKTIACDGIVMSVGWAAAANLLYQAGTKMRFDDRLQQFVPEVLFSGVFACGRVNGVFDFEQKPLDGRRAGLEAAAYLGLGELVGGNSDLPLQDIYRSKQEPPSHPYPIIEHPKGKNFVDFDEDLQLKDFQNAAQEGFDNIELLKRYTTVGMGPSQGKHSNMNALRILAQITGKTLGEVGTTTARPFFHPVPMSYLAGRGFTPERETPLHSRHAELNAKFMISGAWRRPEYYAQLGKSRDECIRAEAEAVRTSVGLIDIGTLGKLEVRGADAAKFLEQVYTGRYANMKVGMTRYALMLDEAGVVIDDGAIARLAPEHFYFTTTTSGATNIYRELTRLNTIWQLECGIVNLTGQRAAVNVAGPYARAVLAKLTDLNLCEIPYLAVREGLVAGIPAILMRLGFVGEWGYEIHVAAEHAPALWDALLEAGAVYGIRPFGVEAQRLLRLEKGHIIIGQDTDGLTTPIAANLEWAVKMDKPFFIGQRSLQIIAKQQAKASADKSAEPVRQLKQKLVGFMLDPNFNGTPPQECHLVIERDEIAGRVTSIGFSPALKRYIGLAYLKPELANPGNCFSIRLSDSSLINAIVSPTPFYDPDNLRQREKRAGEAGGEMGAGGARKAGGEKIVYRNSLSSPASPAPPASPALTPPAPLPRFGVKGAGAAAWLESQGVPLPDSPNTWCPLSGGGLVARLGRSEFLIEDGLNSNIAARLVEKCQQLPSKVYPVLRQDMEIALSGEAVNELLLQTCSVNFRAMSLARPLALTSMVGVSVIVLKSERAGQPLYRIWCDSTYGAYLWRTLVAIIEELGGVVIEADTYPSPLTALPNSEKGNTQSSIKDDVACVEL